MGLEEYKAKRKFNKTPEPAGEVEKDRKGVHRFVVQKHAASRLHYDFRLEMQGVYKSWAIPKGPSLNPQEKRLAVMVEDHPLEYGKFEGIIPPGNYGAGTVMIWDEGTYYAPGIESWEDNEKQLLATLYKGDLKIVLEGKKLKGEFVLVRTAGGKGNEWLLIKKKDAYATKDPIIQKDRSVVTNRTLEEIKEQSGKGSTVWYSKRETESVPELENIPEGRFPHNIKPMLASLAEAPFDSPEWIFEIKWDGFRAIAEVNYNEVNLYSRNLLSFNEQFEPIVNSLAKLSTQAVFDGEIVVLNDKGVAEFQLIQNYKRTGQGRLVYYVFDLLYYEGRNLQSLPLLRRKEILKKILPDLPNVVYNEHFIETGIQFFEAARQQDLEGIIAKRAESVYKPGVRTKDWLKIKIQKRLEAVIAGFTQPRGGRKLFGALVLGLYNKKGELEYIGHTGGGFDEKVLQEVYKKLKPLIQSECPFAKRPKTNTPVTWVKPVLVCEVKFQEWTDEGVLRMPVFLGLREDKNAREVTKEESVKMNEVAVENSSEHLPEDVSDIQEPILPESSSLFKNHLSSSEAVINLDNRILKFTNLDKVFWEEEGYTKRELIEYYDKIADYILPYLKDRPQSLKRNPNGYKDAGFFQKDMPSFIPSWIPTVAISSDSQDKEINYMLCQEKATLLYMANLGCIEINPWNSRIQNLDYPDYIVIDLDPVDVPFDAVIEVAQAVKEVLDEGKIPSYPKTSGSKGIHIYIPLGANYTYDQSRQFAEIISTLAHARIPKLSSLLRSPSKRKNKVYLDYLQNLRGQTLASVYCVRPKPGATVSTPLDWAEVKPGLHPSEFTIKTIFKRLDKIGDIFKPVISGQSDIYQALQNLGLKGW
ncbi:MAG TPA: DNA ligase D [Cytophagaceae bacterium]